MTENVEHRFYCEVWKGRMRVDGPNLDKPCTCGALSADASVPDATGDSSTSTIDSTGGTVVDGKLVETPAPAPTVGLWTLPPEAPLRDITFLHVARGLVTTKGHAALVDHGALLIQIHRGNGAWTTEIYPMGAWADVKVSLPSREELEMLNQVFNQFHNEQAAVVRAVEMAEAAAQHQRADNAKQAGKESKNKAFLGGTH